MIGAGVGSDINEKWATCFTQPSLVEKPPKSSQNCLCFLCWLIYFYHENEFSIFSTHPLNYLIDDGQYDPFCLPGYFHMSTNGNTKFTLVLVCEVQPPLLANGLAEQNY